MSGKHEYFFFVLLSSVFRERLDRGFNMASEPPAKLDYKSRQLVRQIVEHVKSQGIFDQFRRGCIEELEQKVGLRTEFIASRKPVVIAYMLM